MNTPYIFLDHIASPNAAAKINSGVFGDDDTLEFDICFSVDAYLQYNAIFGNYIDENTNCWRLIQGSYDVGSLIVGTNTRAGSGGSIRVYDASYVNKKIHIVLNNSKTTSIVDGITREVNSPTTKGTTNNEAISIGSSGIRSVYGPYKKTWYWVKISQNGILIRDYRPCYSRIDDKYGFFDVISKTFNPSSGGTDFTAN